MEKVLFVEQEVQTVRTGGGRSEAFHSISVVLAAGDTGNPDVQKSSLSWF